jgi:hypothetical protein
MNRVTLVLAMLVGSTVAVAGGVQEKKARDAVDAAAAKAASDIKSCGKKFTVTFDWKAYDAIDWKGIGRDKLEYMENERMSLADLGLGLDKLCADKDYKAAFVKVSTIVYKSTNDDKITVKATIAGSTLTISNYSFGSTRHADDYETAAKAAL